MLIYHYTDLKSALNIILTKKYIAYSNNIYNGDSGLNSFTMLQGVFNYEQNFNKTGVILVFDWSGKVEENVSIYFQTYKMKPDCMYIQGAWRSFIPVNSSSKFLKVVDIIIENNEAIEELIEYPIYYHFIPNFFAKIKYNLYKKYRTRAENMIIESFKEKDIYISII